MSSDQKIYLWLMVIILLALAVIFEALKALSTSVFGDVPENMPRGDTRLWVFAPLAVLGILILVLGVYLPPQLETLLNQATNIALAGQLPAASRAELINLARAIIP